MSLLGMAKVAINADLSPLRRGLSVAHSMVKSSMRRIASAIRRMSSIVKRLMKRLSQIIIVSIGFSIKAFADFEQQIAMVSTMLDKQTMDFLPEYSKELRRMSIEFGESTKTLSKGLYDILSASIPAADALGVLTVSAKAAKAGMTDTGIAADAITTILNSYQMQASEAGKVSNWLFAIVKKGKTTFPELAQNIGKVAAMAAVAGLRFEEVGAAIATMTRAGLRADLATTSLRAIMNTFLKPTADSAAAAEEFGFKLNSATLQALGLTGVLKLLKGASAEQIAMIFPNIRAMSGLAATLKQAEGAMEDLDFITNSSNMDLEAYEKMTNTTRHTLNQLWQAFKDVGVEVGERFAPDIEKLTEFFIKNKKVISDWAVFLAEKIREGVHRAIEWIRKMVTAFKSGELMYQLAETGKALGTALADAMEGAIKERFPMLSAILGTVGKTISASFGVAKVTGLVAGRIASGNENFNLPAVRARGFRSSEVMEQYLQDIAENTRKSEIGSMN